MGPGHTEILRRNGHKSRKMTAETLEGPTVHPKLREKLEKMEIESPGCVVPFEVYGQLLAVYLYDNDL